MALAAGNTDISNELWQSALQALERKFSKPIYEMWIKPLRLISLNGNELLLAVQNTFAREWVENRLKAQIVEALAETFGTVFELQFEIVEATGETPVPEGAASPAAGGARLQTEFRPAISTRAIRLKSLSSATPTASRTRRRKRWRQRRPAHTIRSSYTAASDSARRT